MGTRNRKKGRKKKQKQKQPSQLSNVGSHADFSSAEATPKHLQSMTPYWKNLYILIQKEMKENS